jgi:hypothetical protein
MNSSTRQRVPTQMRRSSARTAGPAEPRFSSRRGLFSLVLVAFLSVLLGSACLSPTLPLPPPSVTSIHASEAADGTWSITGDCIPGAIVTAFNEVTGKGAVVEDRDMTGRFTIPIKATLCDLGWVKQEQDADLSTRMTFVVQDLTESGPTDPSACKASN